MHSLSRPLSAACAALLACALPAHADLVVTKDGRSVEALKVREVGDRYEITLKAGTISCPKSDVASAEIVEDAAEYVPKNDDEKKKLESGFVRFNGRWMTKTALQVELDKRAKESQKRAADHAQHSDFFKGWTKESQHFKFQSNTSPELLDYYANLLEAYYNLMDSRIGIKPTPTLRATKMKVNIFKNMEEFLTLAELPTGYGTLGYFSPPLQTLNFYHDFSDPALSTWVALHECTHLLTYLIDPQFVPSVYSIWVNEGVADFFGSAEVTVDPKSKKITIQPGKLQLHRTLTVQGAIKEGNDVKLKDLLETTYQNFGGFEYAHAWSFIYYLNSKDTTRKAFASFFKDLYTRTGVESKRYGNQVVVEHAEINKLLLSKLKTKDLDALDKEWKAFIAAIPLDGPEARFERARYYIDWGGGDEDQSRKDLEAAIEGGITHPAAYAGRAELAWRKGDRDQAIADMRRALELDPLNAQYHYMLARAVSRAEFFIVTGPVRVTVKGASTRTRLDSRLTQAEVDEGEKHLSFAAELDPQDEQYAKVLEKYKRAKDRWIARKAKGAAPDGEGDDGAGEGDDAKAPPKSGDGG